MTLPMRCPSSLDSVLTLAADGSASPLTAIEAVCWGEGTLEQCADTQVADSMARANRERVSRAPAPLLHARA